MDNRRSCFTGGVSFSFANRAGTEGSYGQSGMEFVMNVLIYVVNGLRIHPGISNKKI